MFDADTVQVTSLIQNLYSALSAVSQQCGTKAAESLLQIKEVILSEVSDTPHIHFVHVSPLSIQLFCKKVCFATYRGSPNPTTLYVVCQAMPIFAAQRLRLLRNTQR